jgi:hypothetical protein
MIGLHRKHAVDPRQHDVPKWVTFGSAVTALLRRVERLHPLPQGPLRGSPRSDYSAYVFR